MIHFLGQNFKGMNKWLVIGRAADIAKELEQGGPAGVLCLDTLGHLVDRKLRVHYNGQVIGEYGKGEVVDIEYLKGTSTIGHWIGPCGDVESLGNNCLFDAIGQVVGRAGTDLRLSLTDLFQSSGWLYARVCAESPCLLGGARYTAQTVDDAAAIIDRSHGSRGHHHARKAHPRGHASHPMATGPEDSVEKYSATGIKSGWLSRADQNRSVHEIMQMAVAQEALEDLNNGSLRVSFTITPPTEIRMGEWDKGKLVEGPLEARAVTVVLQHHCGKKDNPEEEVQIFTCFPRKFG